MPWISIGGIIFCAFAIPYMIYDNSQRVEEFKERCVKSGGIPDTYRMVCYSKSSVLFVR